MLVSVKRGCFFVMLGPARSATLCDGSVAAGGDGSVAAGGDGSVAVGGDGSVATGRDGSGVAGDRTEHGHRKR